MPIKLIIVFLFIVAFALAAPPPKAKATVAKGKPAAVIAKGKPATVVAKGPASAAKKPAVGAYRAPATSAARLKAAPPRIANSRAVYSRTPARYAKAPVGRRAPVLVRQPQVFVPQVPSADRYREIQQALADKGFFMGEASGTWSSESAEALKTFQRSQNLDADGKLGSLSLIALGLGPKRVIAAQNISPSQQPQR